MIITEEERKEPQIFYHETLELLEECNANYMIEGAFAVFHYTGVLLKSGHTQRFFIFEI